jgi:hypothetical protein
MVKRATKMEAKAKNNLQTEETERNSHTQGWLRVNGESEEVAVAVANFAFGRGGGGGGGDGGRGALTSKKSLT